MPANRKVSSRQLEILISLVEGNRDIALGRCTRGPQNHQTTLRFWDNVALKLNAVADGITKSRDQWRRYWIELKAKTKGKAADNRRNAKGTGGGPNKLFPLTDYEERILQIVGPVAVEGLPGVRIPFQQPSTSGAGPIISTSEQVPNSEEVCFASDDYIEEEWLCIQSPTPPLETCAPTSETRLISPTPPIIVSSPPPMTPTPQPLTPPPVSVPDVIAERRPRRRRTVQDPDLPRWAIEFERRRQEEEEERSRATQAFRSQLLLSINTMNRTFAEIRDAILSKK